MPESKRGGGLGRLPGRLAGARKAACACATRCRPLQWGVMNRRGRGLAGGSEELQVPAGERSSGVWDRRTGQLPGRLSPEHALVAESRRCSRLAGGKVGPVGTRELSDPPCEDRGRTFSGVVLRFQ